MNFKFEVIPFDHIIDAVKRGEVDAGLLIHEGQITYQQAGLHRVLDLGEWWHADTGLPVPLGLNAVRKDLGKQLMRKVASLLAQSIQYGFDHRAEAVGYAQQFSRGLDQPSTERFVMMYVNRWTLEMGRDGREAIARLLARGYHAAMLPRPVHLEFVE